MVLRPVLRSTDTGSRWRHGLIVGILYTLAVVVGLWTIDWQGRQVRESER